jgi:DNA-binding transcriptional MocR family regulator
MLIELDRSRNVPLYRQIMEQLRARIVSGELAPGTRLPPERRLAAVLGVNRTTVVNAYRELAADGLIVGHVGRGTVVADPGRLYEAATSAGGIPWLQLFTPATELMNDPLLQDTMLVSSRPDVVTFATGMPAPELYPVTTVRQLLDEALHQVGPSVLQYCPLEGYAPLREALAGWNARSGIRYGPDEILVVAGSQQGLYLLARALLEPGDVVAVESPTYLGALQVFRAVGARLLPIPVDQHGLRVGLLEDVAARRRPKLIYTLPTFQNPTGTTMSRDRRERLLALAARLQIPVVEDDPYGALRYTGESIPPLAALDQRQSVIYLSTVSKILFPGFRIGWITAPRPVIERLAVLKQIVDLDTNALAQWAVWALISRGLLDAHLERLRQHYPERLQRMLDALGRHASGLLEWTRPAGGFYVWCRLADGMRARDLLPEAARRGVAFAPGKSFHPDDAGEGTLRLNFTYPPVTAIDTGIARLAEAVETLRKTSLNRDSGRRARLVAPLV